MQHQCFGKNCWPFYHFPKLKLKKIKQRLLNHAQKLCKLEWSAMHAEIYYCMYTACKILYCNSETCILANPGHDESAVR